MKRNSFIAAVVFGAIFMTACGNSSGSSLPELDMSDSAAGAASAGNVSFDVGSYENLSSDFRMESEKNGGFSVSGSVYTISAAGTYDCYGNLYEGQIIVDAGENDEVVINLNGCTITNSSDSPVFAKSADKVEISAKKDAENKICDLRKAADGEDASGAGIYAECDLTLKGNGSLEIISEYNNGIHTKDDLKIKNLSLAVKAPNNAIKGNDSVTIESGTVIAVSTLGDAIKTTSTDLSKKGEQRGRVVISGGNIALYAACDGIDSASDVEVSGEAELEIYTDEYSSYSGKKAGTVSQSGNSAMNFSPAELPDAVTGATPDGDLPFGDGGFDGQKPEQMPDGGFDRGNRGGFKGQKPDQNADGNTDQNGEFSRGNKGGRNPGQMPEMPDGGTFPFDKGGFGGNKGGGFGGFGGFGDGNAKLEYSCKGIKAANIIEITGGTVTIKSRDDGIHANFDDVLESTGKNGAGNVIISGGNITVTSGDDGIHADQDLKINGGTVNVSESYEGLEANRIFISDGKLKICASDDAINANNKGAYSASIEISGGSVDAEVPGGDTDTIDSNGTITISGGFVFLKNGQMSGSGFAGGTIDCDRGVNYTGGTVIAIGCIGERINGSSYSTSQSFESGNYSLADGGGNTIAEFTLDSSYKAYMICSDKLESGKTYTVRRDSAELFSFTK